MQFHVPQNGNNYSEFRQDFLYNLSEAMDDAATAYLSHVLERNMSKDSTNSPRRISNVEESNFLNRGESAATIKAYVFHQNIYHLTDAELDSLEIN
jgi:hypothetical protein